MCPQLADGAADATPFTGQPLRSSVAQAAAVSAIKLALWHWSQPLAYLLVFQSLLLIALLTRCAVWCIKSRCVQCRSQPVAYLFVFRVYFCQLDPNQVPPGLPALRARFVAPPAPPLV